MMSVELQALQDADFGWVQSLDSIWSDDDPTDAGPNQDLADQIINQLSRLTTTPNPPCRAFLGQAGIGKTHFVGVLRRRAWASGAWFVMLDVVGITDFWKSTALSFVTSLLQEMPGGKRQYEAVIDGVARRFKIEKQVNIAFSHPTVQVKQVVDLLVGALIRTEPASALQHQDVFRALALLRSNDLATVSIAHAWLQGYDANETMRQSLGFLMPPPSPVEIVRGLLWVMGLAAPTLIAVDQIDGVISAGERRSPSPFDSSLDFTALLSGGLLDLARVMNRGMLVLTCLLSSWEILKNVGAAPLIQSFSPPVPMRLPQNGSFIRTLIAGRLAPAYAKAGITPISPAWPVTQDAIDHAPPITPRLLLMRCDEHRTRCLAAGKILPLDSFNPDRSVPPETDPPVPEGFDARLSAAEADADLDGLLDAKDDGKLGMLLRDAFALYTQQIPPRDDVDVVSKADPAHRTPPLHGRLTFIDHRANDAEQHFCFRALQHSHPVALCARFRAALTASGISAGSQGRKLIIVRRDPIPSGAKTAELFHAFRAAGGVEINPSDADLRRFVALRNLRDQTLASGEYGAFERWLVARQPLCGTAFFQAAGLCPPPLPTQADAPVHAQQSPYERKPAPSPIPSVAASEAASSSASLAPAQTHIAVGHRIPGNEPVTLPISLLPRHTAIIAGAGSGKTVLLRRIVEEAALAGIPAIVIDPNNDLSRLGDVRPERPASFTAEDDRRASLYHQSVEVVIWTPGISAGNPIFLPVLPDFAAIGNDPDEQEKAVAMAAETLLPLAGVKNNLAKGVLSDALRHFAAGGGGTLKDMTDLLADLPDSVSTISEAAKLAGKMADGLKAAVASNPLLRASGPVLDPRLLFFGADAHRTRVSVINLSGLGSDQAREDFVNRLQMTLFGWIKRNPSPRGMLYVIDEAQIFLPSGRTTLSKTSGVQLVAQARKYGLGMIMVTQAPKGIENQVVSNCTTQFLGKQNAPATIDAVKEMIAAAGGSANDVGKLPTGEFYFKTELSGKPFKVKTPICLSWHPPNPPTPEEVVAKAARS
jgi:DNA helicase HerA-like ATPase